MSQVRLLVALAAAVAVLGPVGAAAADDFSPAEAEAARDGLQSALQGAVTAAAAKTDELDLPPSISESVRRVAFVQVDTVKEAKNIRAHGLGSLRTAGTIGVDPIAAGQTVNFTVPVELVGAYLTGDLVRKVNDVGPTGHFNTTIATYRLEAEGTATVSRGACAFNFTAVKDIELGGVDTSVEGASLLNRVLAKEVSDGVRSGAVAIKDPISRHVLQSLQEAPQDCAASVRERLAKVPAAAAPAA